PIERHVLARRVYVAEQSLRLAVQENAARARRGEDTVERARALSRHVGNIAPVARPLLYGKLPALLHDLHGLAAVLQHQGARGINLGSGVRDAYVDGAFLSRPALTGRSVTHALHESLQRSFRDADQGSGQ